MQNPYIKKLNELNMQDLDLVGGKNASLGEMIGNLTKLGVNVPGGFATTSHAYRDFLKHENLGDRINEALSKLDVDNLSDLTETGKQIRKWVLETKLPEKLRSEIQREWEEITNGNDLALAVRSSATAEDLPDASFEDNRKLT